jgi:hypothetical protein
VTPVFVARFRSIARTDDALDALGDFQLVSGYLEDKLSTQLKRKLRFVECDGDAANVWILEHADEVAFLSSERRLQAQVASPILGIMTGHMP